MAKLFLVLPVDALIAYWQTNFINLIRVVPQIASSALLR
jgi:hypothetical protein